MTDVPEEWRPVPGREEYEVSDLGRVRRGDRILNGTRTAKGYREVSIKSKLIHVHRLVALAFIGPVPPKCEVRHLNDVSDDNRLVNLAYGTHTQNMLDRIANGHDTQANKTECIYGHPFTAENTRVMVRKNGRLIRRCRTCERDYAREWMRGYRARQKEATS